MINWIDILLLAVIALYAYIGFRRGFILGVVDLIAWLGSLIVSFLLFPYVALALQKLIPSLGAWVNVISFLVAFMAVRLVVSLLLSLAVARIPNHVQVSPVNKFFGIIPGVFSGIVTAAVIALLIMVVPWTDGLAEQTRNSKVADELTRPAAWVEDKVSPVIDSVINKTVASLMVEPESEASVKLPFTTTHVTARPGLEAQMLQLVNEERIKQGLQALKPDTALTSVARAHSRDMFARVIFHTIRPRVKTLLSACVPAVFHF